MPYLMELMSVEKQIHLLGGQAALQRAPFPVALSHQLDRKILLQPSCQPCQDF